MMDFERYAHLLALEAQRHIGLAEIAETEAVKAAHCETVEAMLMGAILTKKEAARRWKSCQKSEIKKHLCLRPLRAACCPGQGSR